MPYVASSKRYTEMEYRLCGRSGLRLPLISLGLWHNFGDNKPFDNCQAMLLTLGSPILILLIIMGHHQALPKVHLAKLCSGIFCLIAMKWLFHQKRVSLCGMALMATGEVKNT